MARTPRPRRKRPVASWMTGVAVALAAVAAAPHHAVASNNTEEDEHYDARVQGYDPPAEAKGASAAMQWMMLIGAAVVCVGVLFKDAKRTHLD